MKVTGLAARDPDLSELLRVEGEDSLRDHSVLTTTESHESGVDWVPCLIRELLVEDALRQGEEWGVEDIEGWRWVEVDERAEQGVDGAEVTEGRLHLALAGKGSGSNSGDNKG